VASEASSSPFEDSWATAFEQVPDEHGQTRLWFPGSLEVAGTLSDVERAARAAADALPGATVSG